VYVYQNKSYGVEHPNIIGYPDGCYLDYIFYISSNLTSKYFRILSCVKHTFDQVRAFTSSELACFVQNCGYMVWICETILINTKSI
jgi:hypothetical protein